MHATTDFTYKNKNYPVSQSIQVIPRIREDKKQYLFPSFLEKELF
jgi:hypothetical protein